MLNGSRADLSFTASLGDIPLSQDRIAVAAVVRRNNGSGNSKPSSAHIGPAQRRAQASFRRSKYPASALRDTSVPITQAQEAKVLKISSALPSATLDNGARKPLCRKCCQLGRGKYSKLLAE